MRVLGASLAILLGLASAPGFTNAAPAAPDDQTERLRLAQALMIATHRQELMRDVYAKQLRAALTYCHDELCQADLDKAIADATLEVSKKYAYNMAQLLAQKLTVKQLSAALRFSRSSEGQQIAAAEAAMTDELAQISHASALYAQKLIDQRLCASHPEVCRDGLGGKLPARPKT